MKRKKLHAEILRLMGQYTNEERREVISNVAEAECVRLRNILKDALQENEQLLEVYLLADRLCDAFDRADEDIGGESPKTVLALLGPAVDKLRALVRVRYSEESQGKGRKLYGEWKP